MNIFKKLWNWICSPVKINESDMAKKRAEYERLAKEDKAE